MTVSLVLALALAAGPQTESAPAVLQEIRAATLQTARPLAVEQLKLECGLATITLEQGVVFPATPVGGQVVEMVFLGRGRLTLEAPDPIEAAQLELFTGHSALDQPFDEALLVIASDEAAAAVMRRPAATPTAAQAARARALFTQWKESPERRQLGVETRVFSDALGDRWDPAYFAGRFHNEELGTFLYVVDPGESEQVMLGQFVPIETSEREKRLIERELHREQRRGRWIGLRIADLGQWDTWLSASLREAGNRALPGSAGFEPERYVLDTTLEEGGVRLRGHARIDLRSLVAGHTVVELTLDADAEILRVTDGSGRELAFARSTSSLAIVLPAPSRAGERLSLEIHYAGTLLEKLDGGLYALNDTLSWYPHVGSIDRATYEATFRWPAKLDLLAAGERVNGGIAADGTKWEQRRLDQPSAGFSFEVGSFKTERTLVGKVAVVIAFDREGRLLSKQARQEIAATVGDALGYFENAFGSYPLGQLTVVTVPRDFSQAMPGFVTLSTRMMDEIGWVDALLGMEDRRTVVAHEIAHQWWGHLVGWKSYRDQWISEAMANLAALRYSRARLDWKGRYQLGPTTGWQSALGRTTEDGRTLESVGPLVLGGRLGSSRASAYVPVVYKKGALVLDMLARRIGEASFEKILREIFSEARGKVVSTEDFIRIVEKHSGASLALFAQRFIYGTGIPEVYYDYRFEPRAGGKWGVKGMMRQRGASRVRHRIVALPGGRYDVVREKLAGAGAGPAAVVVPVLIQIDDAAAKGVIEVKKGQTTVARGVTQLSGPRSEFDLELQWQPKRVWLDPDKEVLAHFYDEKRSVRRVLYHDAMEELLAGDEEQAEATLKRALASPAADDIESDLNVQLAGQLRKDVLEVDRAVLEARIHLELARLYLTQGREPEMRQAIDHAGDLARRHDLESVNGTIRVLEARHDLRRGEHERAYKRLGKQVLRRGEIGGAEAWAVIAIAASAGKHAAELERALEEAKRKGVDVSLLER